MTDVQDPHPESYDQWICMTIKDSNVKNGISIENASLDCGKFYTDGDKDHEIPASEVDKIVIASGQKDNVYSCGRQGTATGTTGDIDLYDGNEKIGGVHWNCPWWGSNVLETRDFDPSTSDYSIILDGVKSSGPIGEVNVTVAKFG